MRTWALPFHTCHLVSVSPWPLLVANSAFLMMTALVVALNHSLWVWFLLGVLGTGVTAALWWLDVTVEALSLGSHSGQVLSGLRGGMLLFILSEVLFFISFFWGFLHFGLNPVEELGNSWPPAYLDPFNPLHIPLLNTLILLSSGVSVTMSHHDILLGRLWAGASGLTVTVILAVLFSYCQYLEYSFAIFTFMDSCYGSTFFTVTSFHGIHVLLGSVFLLCSFTSLTSFSLTHSSMFEFAIWYWHFVDLVWLFLYTCFYWWSL